MVLTYLLTFLFLSCFLYFHLFDIIRSLTFCMFCNRYFSGEYLHIFRFFFVREIRSLVINKNLTWHFTRLWWRCIIYKTLYRSLVKMYNIQDTLQDFDGDICWIIYKSQKRNPQGIDEKTILKLKSLLLNNNTIIAPRAKTKRQKEKA